MQCIGCCVCGREDHVQFSAGRVCGTVWWSGEFVSVIMRLDECSGGGSSSALALKSECAYSGAESRDRIRISTSFRRGSGLCVLLPGALAFKFDTNILQHEPFIHVKSFVQLSRGQDYCAVLFGILTVNDRKVQLLLRSAQWFVPPLVHVRPDLLGSSPELTAHLSFHFLHFSS
jgi:hypothetical protein